MIHSREADAFAVNATGTQTVAIEASQTVAKLMQVSTDYVFNGSVTSPYDEASRLYSISGGGRTGAWALAGISPMRNWRAALSAAHSAGVLG
jgi:dTDP-4-dehydrorhamnose reductase